MTVRLALIVGIPAAVYACTGADPVLSAQADGGAATDAGDGPDGAVDGSTTPGSWASTFGSARGDRMLDAKVDAAGNTYVLGASAGPLVGPGGEPSLPIAGDYFVARVDADGRLRWAKSLAAGSGATLEEPHLALGDTRVLLSIPWNKNAANGLIRIADVEVGSESSGAHDTAIASLAAEDGRAVVTRNISAGEARRVELVIGAGPTDSAVLFGRLQAEVNLGGPPLPASYLTFGMTPAFDGVVFRQPLGGNGPAGGVDITSTADNTVVVTGRVAPGRALHGETAAPSMVATSTASFVSEIAPYLGFRTVFTTRLAPLAPPDAPGDRHVVAEHTAVAPEARVTVGTFRGFASFGNDVSVQIDDGKGEAYGGYVAALDGDGKARKALALLDGDAIGGSRRVAIAKDGSIIVAATFSGTARHGVGDVPSAGSTDGIVTVYDAALAPLRVHHLGGAGLDSVRGLGVAPDGTVIVAGELTGTVTLPGGQRAVAQAGVTSLYVTRFKP